ncbi:MAG: hypothetical protein WCO00_12785 [Rhodospirillaceae bacterium]
MPDSSETSPLRAATQSRAAVLASIETGAHMLSAALRQLDAVDRKVERQAPNVSPRLQADREEIGEFIAELIDKYLPAERRGTPRNGVRPLPARVASARTLEALAER